MNGKKIAIIGSGISGLTCGFTLSEQNEIIIYEAADYVGGHTHTVRVEKDGEMSDIDTGFIVFNDRTYPNFIALMDELGVTYQPTEMSFSVKNDQLGLEYNGNTLNSMFAQRSNLVKPKFLAMLLEITQFNKDVRKVAQNNPELSIGQYLDTRNYGPLFKENYLLPMISAIWSMGLKSCMDFPLGFFVKFFENHGLLDLANRPQWYTIVGGSSSYIDPLINGFKGKIRLSSRVVSVKRADEGVLVNTRDDSNLFDKVIFACHGDQALKLLEQPSEKEALVLQNFEFSNNHVVLHTDTSFLPKKKLAWASWNYNMVDAADKQTTLTYNMNILQRLQKKRTYLVTLNQEIKERYILGRYEYRHPVYSNAALNAQQQWSSISGVDKIHYCGAYWFNGFHEDGVTSALRVSRTLEAHR